MRSGDAAIGRNPVSPSVARVGRRNSLDISLPLGIGIDPATFLNPAWLTRGVKPGYANGACRGRKWTRMHHEVRREKTP
jgi:hypothetical protein